LFLIKKEYSMKKIILRNSLGAAVGLMALGLSGTASAHTITGALAAGAAKADFLQIACPQTGTARLSFRIQDNSGNTSRVFAVVQKGTSSCTAASPCVATSAVASDVGNTWSPWANVPKATGTYNVFVGQSGATGNNYTIEAHCENASGVHLDQGDPVNKQNL
jgi:hypothetical protein